MFLGEDGFRMLRSSWGRVGVFEVWVGGDWWVLKSVGLEVLGVGLRGLSNRVKSVGRS